MLFLMGGVSALHAVASNSEEVVSPLKQSYERNPFFSPGTERMMLSHASNTAKAWLEATVALLVAWPDRTILENDEQQRILLFTRIESIKRQQEERFRFIPSCLEVIKKTVPLFKKHQENTAAVHEAWQAVLDQHALSFTVQDFIQHFKAEYVLTAYYVSLEQAVTTVKTLFFHEPQNVLETIEKYCTHVCTYQEMALQGQGSMSFLEEEVRDEDKRMIYFLVQRVVYDQAVSIGLLKQYANECVIALQGKEHYERSSRCCIM